MYWQKSCSHIDFIIIFIYCVPLFIVPICRWGDCAITISILPSMTHLVMIKPGLDPSTLNSYYHDFPTVPASYQSPTLLFSIKEPRNPFCLGLFEEKMAGLWGLISMPIWISYQVSFYNLAFSNTELIIISQFSPESR